MQIRVLHPQSSLQRMQKAVRFCRRYSSGRITRHALARFAKMKRELLAQPGNHVLIALSAHGGTVGVLACADYGRDFSLMVVHPRWRGYGVGKMMLRNLLAIQPRFHARVAIDNFASLKACFECGMRARDIRISPYGKPTLLLEYGTERSIGENETVK